MADAFEDEADQTISMDEYIEKIEAEELEADLVLGGDDGQECTYNNGYMNRQAIFSCLTCTPDGNAGICTACSLSCHDGHEVLELWTKRNFRCDCGNSRFGTFFCKLFANKDVENIENSYNHNFKGLYCTCDRPYPDPDVEEQVEMIQCCMCEDWFHEEHLGLGSSQKIPRDEEGEPTYEDFICKACSAVCSFLTLYPQSIFAEEGKSDATVKTSKDKDVLEDNMSACGSGMLENHTSIRKDDQVASANCESLSGGKKLVTGECSEKNIGSNHHTKDATPHTCALGDNLVSASPILESQPLFLSKHWRDILCRCEKCLNMYNQSHISHLLDKEDSIAEYEQTAKQRRKEKLQQLEGAETNLFNNLGHIQKMEILNGIADFKNEFSAFVESMDPSKTITSDDVHKIFDNLQKKRRRLE
ncbi:zf-UBR domain-containing protein [Cephalotus follicularis]|uniref:Zf-UBR domain-containing protein n=1 Tax=Cephalotus follicularis TaxID=3775 RepID=A0A1Q3BCZ1_CEPFO|nr:zf-UBR domain-containing protein [Cephalotus follicularis]